MREEVTAVGVLVGDLAKESENQAEEATEAARAFPQATIVPLHFEGWEHFSESRKEIEAAFRQANMQDRLSWPKAGVKLELP